MKSPRQTKFRKYQKNIRNPIKGNKNILKNKSFGIKSLLSFRLHPRVIETVRRVCTRKFRRKGKIIIQTFPNYPVSKKGNESRMGKGKGSVVQWLCPIPFGHDFFEIKRIPQKKVREAASISSYKLPMKNRFVRFIPTSLNEFLLP